jgi:hypothetical protein
MFESLSRVIYEANDLQRAKEWYGQVLQRSLLKAEKVPSFFHDRGFALEENLTARDMEQKFLKLSDGSVEGRILSIFCLATAIRL